MALYKEYSIEYIKGYVKNIPMQNPIKPVSAARKDTIIKAKINKGCFKISWALNFMPSMAFRFPKTIKGMVKKVKKVIDNEVKIPMDCTPARSTSVDIPVLNAVIRNVAPTMFMKNGGL